MIRRPSLLPEELSKHELCRLAVIAHETPHYDLTKAAIALLMTSPLLFPESPITAVEEMSSTDMERLKADGRLKPFPEELKAKHEARLKATVWAGEAGPVSREVTQSQIPKHSAQKAGSHHVGDSRTGEIPAAELNTQATTPIPTVDDIRQDDDGRGFPAAPEPQTEKTVADAIVEEGARLGIIDVPTASDLAAIAKRHAGILESHAQMGEAPITPGKSKRNWSAEEDARLIAFVEANPPPRRWDAEIIEQLFPGRSPKAAQMRAERLGLIKGDGAKTAAAEEPEPDALREAPGVQSSPGADARAQQLSHVKENLDEMFPPGRSSAVRESPPSRVEPRPDSALPRNTMVIPPAPWEPKETLRAPDTISDVVAWCQHQGDAVTKDGRMFVVNNRKLFPTEFIARANHLRVAANVKPFGVVIDDGE